MTDRMDIRESETGVVRVFHLDLPAEAIERYTVQAGTGEWPLMYGMGATKLSASFIDIVKVKDLGGMSLTSYLTEAHGIPAAALAADAARLNAVRGHVLIFPSQAFARTAQSLTIRTPLRWLGTYEEPRPSTMAAPIRSKAAKGVTGTKSPQPQAMGSGLVKLVLLALLALALVVGIWLVFGG